LVVSTASSAEAIPWAGDYRQAAEQAARDRKLVLLHFWSDDCPPCRRVEANVFPQPDVVSAIQAAYIPVKVHVDRAPELARRYQVTRWPTDVIVTPAGQEVYRTVSPQEPARYVAMLNETAARSGSALARTESSAQAEKSDIKQTAGYLPGRSNSPENNDSDYQPLSIDPGTPVGPSASPNPSAAPPYAGPARGGDFQAANSAAPASDDSQYLPLSGDVDPGAISPRSSPRFDSPRPSLQTTIQPSVQSGSDMAQPQANPYVAPRREAAAPPPARQGLPPLGMDGYCVITLAEKGAWAKGDKRYGAIHRGRLYLFVSPEAQKAFLADPDRFSPALSGYDPVRFAETGELVDGKRAHGLSYNGQTYLFADEAGLARFQAAPRGFAETVYQAMLKSDNAPKYR
jgi:protein disulfide-isomerase